MRRECNYVCVVYVYVAAFYNEGMSMAAIAAYVRQLREAQGISRDRLGEMVGTAGNNIWRIEDQGQEPRGGLLILIIEALRGSFDDAVALLRDDVGEDEGRRRAMARLTVAQQARINAFTSGQGAEEAADAADLIRSDPELRRAILRLADAMRDEPR